METSVTIRIDSSEKDKLKQLAKEQDLSVSQLVRRIIRDYLNNC